jgi:hypothetical protein
MRMFIPLFSTFMLCTVGCTDRRIDGGEDDGQLGVPDWSPCVFDGEFETCEAVCAARGTTCVADGCPADPQHCVPGACEMATQSVGVNDLICTDPSVGGYVSSACDAPILWGLNNTTRCCCED